MKLFQNIPKIEGERSSDINSAFITFGTCMIHSGEIKRLPDGTIEDNILVHDGWYLRICSPFTVSKKVINPITFDDYNGPCRMVILFRHRKSRITGISTTLRQINWFPADLTENDKPEIRYDDPYLHAINIKDKL